MKFGRVFILEAAFLRSANGQISANLVFLQERMKVKSCWKKSVDDLLVRVGAGEELHIAGLESQHEWGCSHQMSH